MVENKKNDLSKSKRRFNPILFFGVCAAASSVFWFFVISVTFRLEPLYIAPLAISLTAFILCGYDKGIAPTNSTRVPEIILLVTALFGGSAGLLLGMKFFRHKTRIASFKFFLLIVLVLQVAAIRFLHSM